MLDTGVLLPAFQDPVHDAQQTFRLLMDVFAAPATIRNFSPAVMGPSGLLPVTTAILLALADADAPVWIDSGRENYRGIADYLRFHTGARIVSDPAEASFAVVDGNDDIDCFRFNTGTPEYPDRSTTVVVQSEQLIASGLRYTGPGLKQPVMFSARPLWHSFADDFAANGNLFPCGLDFIVVATGQLAAMPRSLRCDGAR